MPGDELSEESNTLAIGVAAFIGKDRGIDIFVDSDSADEVHVRLGQLPGLFARAIVKPQGRRQTAAFMEALEQGAVRAVSARPIGSITQ